MLFGLLIWLRPPGTLKSFRSCHHFFTLIIKISFPLSIRPLFSSQSFNQRFSVCLFDWKFVRLKYFALLPDPGVLIYEFSLFWNSFFPKTTSCVSSIKSSNNVFTLLRENSIWSHSFCSSHSYPYRCYCHKLLLTNFLPQIIFSILLLVL